MKESTKNILQILTGIGEEPSGAYNFRINGQSQGKRDSSNIEIKFKEEGKGLEIYVKADTQGETVHIPVVLDKSGLQEKVYNDFYIGENADITIIAGCGIHNDHEHLTQHDGIHSFYLEKNAKVKYTENHYGEGQGTGQKVLNPITRVFLDQGSTLEMESIQIEGVDYTDRRTEAVVGDGASLNTKEIILTTGTQEAHTDFHVELNGTNSSANVVSRSVAKGESKQIFTSVINGNNRCKGHSECDAIIMDHATVKAVPDVTANHVDAQLIHEAAIGKIAGDQIIKLMTLGMSEEDAEAEIIKGFLR